MDALQGRVHYRRCVQHTSATSQLIMYHSDRRRLKTAVAWILNIKNALLDLSKFVPWKKVCQLTKAGEGTLSVE